MKISEFLTKWEATDLGHEIQFGDYSEEQAIFDTEKDCKAFELSRYQISAFHRGAARIYIGTNLYGFNLMYVSNLLPQTSQAKRGATIEDCLKVADVILRDRKGRCKLTISKKHLGL